MGLLPKLFGSSIKRASRVKPTFKGQVVEAIRISNELAGNARDHAELCATYVPIFASEASFTPQCRLTALECVIEAAVNVEDQPENATTDKLRDFVSHLKNDSMIARYTPYFFIW